MEPHAVKQILDSLQKCANEIAVILFLIALSAGVLGTHIVDRLNVVKELLENSKFGKDRSSSEKNFLPEYLAFIAGIAFGLIGNSAIDVNAMLKGAALAISFGALGYVISSLRHRRKQGGG